MRDSQNGGRPPSQTQTQVSLQKGQPRGKPVHHQQARSGPVPQLRGLGLTCPERGAPADPRACCERPADAPRPGVRALCVCNNGRQTREAPLFCHLTAWATGGDRRTAADGPRPPHAGEGPAARRARPLPGSQARCSS